MSRGVVALAGALLLATAMPLPALAQPPEPTEAELRSRADRGDAAAMNDLGGLILETEDQSRAAEARELFRRSSEAGHAEGKNSYAVMLVLGIGGPQDEATGERLREEAAAEGSVAANLSLGEGYRRGLGGLTRDPVRALTYLRRAAGGGTNDASLKAQWVIGTMYLHGEGVPADPEEAYRWVARSSDGGFPDAMISRAVMLALGQGIAEDDAAARHWYERASLTNTNSIYHALRGLGGMLVSGEGGPTDLERGFAYLFIAKAGGDRIADQVIQQYESRLTPEARERAFGIAHDWAERHIGTSQDRGAEQRP